MSNRYLFQCPIHGEDWEQTVGCEDCTRFQKLNEKNKEASSKITHRIKDGRFSVYWPSEMGHNGRVIENVAHTPQFFSEKRKLRDYFKRHGIAEAG